MSAHDDRRALVADLDKEISQLVLSARVKADHRFVEQEDGRRRKQGGRDQDSLPHSLRERLPHGVTLIRHAHALKQVFGAVLPACRQQAAAADEDHVLPDRQHLVDLGRLGDERHMPAAGGTELDALPGDAAGVRAEQPGQAHQRRCLAGSVRAEEGEDLMRSNVKVEMIDRQRLAETLGEAGGGQAAGCRCNQPDRSLTHDPSAACRTAIAIAAIR